MNFGLHNVNILMKMKINGEKNLRLPSVFSLKAIKMVFITMESRKHYLNPVCACHDSRIPRNQIHILQTKL